MQGKVAVVTGAAKGLGRAFSEALLKNGAKVLISDVDNYHGEETAKRFSDTFGKGRSLFLKCDVTNDKEMREMFLEAKSNFGKLDVVVNNAGICHEKEWEKMININLLAAIRGTWLGFEYMGKENGGNGGTIINVTSVSGLQPTQFVPGYSASKTGLIAFSRSLAANRISQRNNIKINCLCPFFADTDILNFSEDTVIGAKTAKRALEASGIMPVSSVTDAFMDLVTDESMNGEVLLLSKLGRKFVKTQFTSFDELVDGST